MALPSVGKPAPQFTLQDQRGQDVSLADFQGRKHVVLYFYPKAMTPGCIVQACGLRDSKSELEELNVEVLGISPDPVKRLQSFTEKKELNFTLLADEDHAVAEQYGAWGLKKFMGREYMGILRQTYVIDDQGVLRHVFDKVKTKTHHDDVLDWVRNNL